MEKKENYLICTRIGDTFPKNKEIIMHFVSESALNKYPKNSDKQEFYINNSEWVDKKKLVDDFSYLEGIYEKFLPSIKDCLNKIHGCNYSLRFWRILIGPWLGIYIFTLFDRWKNLKSSTEKFKIDKVIKLNFNENFFIPYENKDFLSLIQNDIWNQYLYQSMFEEFFNSDQVEILNLDTVRIKEFKKELEKKDHNINFIKDKIFKLFNFFPKKNYKNLFYSTYMGFWNEIKLSLRFDQIPIFTLKNDKYRTFKKINFNLRSNISFLFDENDKFQNFLVKSIPKQIPKVFIENFNDLIQFSLSENIPEKPEKIITANALWFDSFFTFHVAKLTEKNSEIIYIQHGGAYGISKYSWVEEHEKVISNKYLTWGWQDHKFQSKIKKFYVILKKKKFNWRNKNMRNLLILMRPRKVYFQTPETSSVGIEPYSNYINFCHQFFKSISNEIQNKIVLRFPFKNLNRESFDYFSNLNEYSIDNEGTFERACNKSKIIINTANSTTFCETISNDIPSILVINKNTPIRENILPIIDNLRSNNLIFLNLQKQEIL